MSAGVTLTDLQSGTDRGGVVVMTGTHGIATAALTRAGWRVVRVVGGRTRDEVMDAFATALEFPDYFGRNLDALWDCLRDVEVPTAVVWSGWEPWAAREPGQWAALRDVVDERAHTPPAFALVLATPAR